ncbi:hypothetical protein Prudu_014481 [Prunus dulcis]|uniref:Integrase catalytic domain-containing protein n=1 Tax=Prunus dulcis TaxID=3755 RepID=A0A4Y1RI68_PRUDU|nr:hypothetical protein Prudu_014481 [Prunus dulcis]
MCTSPSWLDTFDPLPIFLNCLLAVLFSCYVSIVPSSFLCLFSNFCSSMATSSSSSSVKIDGLLGMITLRLRDDNFLKWSFQLESVLQGYDLFGHFDGTEVAPPRFAIVDEEGVTSEVTAAYKEWIRADKALLSLLIATLSDEAIEYVIGTKTARDAWLGLSDRYASISRARINHLKTELQTAQKAGDSIERFLLRLKTVRDQLVQAGVKVSDDDFMIATLNGLPQEYDMIKTVLIARDSPISLKDFRAQLLAAEQTAEARLVPHSAMFVLVVFLPIWGPMIVSVMPSLDRNSGSRPVLGNNGGFSRFNDHQHHGIANSQREGFSGFTNHSGSGRGRFQSRASPSSFSGNRFGSNFSQKSAVVPECQICSKRGHTAANCYFRHEASSSRHGSQIQLCLSGSSPPSNLSAMTAQTSYMPDQVWIADSGASHHMVSDISSLTHVAPCESTEQVIVGNGEGLKIKHIGTTAIACASTSLRMPSDRVTKTILLKGRSNNGLYPIPSAVSSHCLSKKVALLGQHVKSSIWHHRLGHPTNEVVQSMLKASGLQCANDSSNLNPLCSACLQGKMHRLPFPVRHSRSEIPFHTFIVTYGVLPITNLLKSDGGGEFLSKVFTDFLASKGIVRRLSCPYTPQQNGLAERKNRHIIETAITLLTTAALPVAPVIVSLPSRPSQASLNSQDPSSLASDTQVSTSQSQSISSTPGSLSPIQHQASLDAAMKEEIDALHMQGTWILVPSPGFSQEPGFDFGETFSPVVRHTTVRLVLSIAAMNQWKLRQLDVKNAFLHGDLEEEVFMKQPPGFEDSTHPQFAPRAWNAKFTGSSDQLIQRVVTDLSEISYNSSGDIFVSQTKYAKDLLHKAGMSSCRACATPCKPHTQVLQTDGEPLADPTMFRSLVGALQYLTFTRPDLAYAVNHGTLEYGISFTKGPWQLNAYSDADWAGDINTRRSTTGCVVFLGCNPISWQSKKQGSVSRSSTEAEYRALANTAADLSWIRQVLLDLKMFLPDAPTMYCDNLSALALSSNPVYHSRIKHLDIDFHFVREKVYRALFLLAFSLPSSLEIPKSHPLLLVKIDVHIILAKTNTSRELEHYLAPYKYEQN